MAVDRVPAISWNRAAAHCRALKAIVSHNYKEKNVSTKIRPVYFVKIILSLSFALVTLPVQAVENYYHGTQCMTANVAQGELFRWSRAGITNNAQIPLYVICPFPAIDQDTQATFPTPRLQVFASVFLPATSTEGVSCVIRVLDATDTGAATNVADHVIVSNQAWTVGGPSFPGQGDVDTASLTVDSSSGVYVQGHLLCLLDPGETVRSYGIQLLD